MFMYNIPECEPIIGKCEVENFTWRKRTMSFIVLHKADTYMYVQYTSAYLRPIVRVGVG